MKNGNARGTIAERGSICRNIPFSGLRPPGPHSPYVSVLLFFLFLVIRF